MSPPAINGGKPCVTGPLARFNTIGDDEINAANFALHGPLSGFIGGIERGGYWVRRLEFKWAQMFGVKHAIACNSATSGLLAAAKAVGLHAGDEFICSPFTMSATAAAPSFTGATPIFCDVAPFTFSLDPQAVTRTPNTKAVFLTHLFGLAIDEGWWTGWARQHGMKVVVDAAQAPLATCDGVYAGTVADIGVFSLNVHKHIQCGEGGICVTNDDELAHRMRQFINHGEMAAGVMGLNLRITEVTAAIALAQLRKAQRVVNGRVEQAESIVAAIGDVSGLRSPYVHPDCKHVYYTIPFTYHGARAWLLQALQAEGVPLVAGYVDPLYRLPAFVAHARACPIAEGLHDRRLFYFENCAYDPTEDQIGQIGDAFHKVVEHSEKARHENCGSSDRA